MARLFRVFDCGTGIHCNANAEDRQTHYETGCLTTHVTVMYAATGGASLAGCRPTSQTMLVIGAHYQVTSPHVSRFGIEKHSFQGESYGQSCRLSSCPDAFKMGTPGVACVWPGRGRMNSGRGARPLLGFLSAPKRLGRRSGSGDWWRRSPRVFSLGRVARWLGGWLAHRLHLFYGSWLLTIARQSACPRENSRIPPFVIRNYPGSDL